jgi:hypothetical protein
VLTLVKRHRGNDDELGAALAHYFGARERPGRPAHPRINPGGGFAVEHG